MSTGGHSDLESAVVDAAVRYQRLLRRLRQEERFEEVADTEAQASQTVDCFLQRILPVLLEVMNAHRGSILMSTPDPLQETAHLYVVSHYGISEENIGRELLAEEQAKFVSLAMQTCNIIKVGAINEGYSNDSLIAGFSYREYHGAVCVTNSSVNYTSDDEGLLKQCIGSIEKGIRDVLRREEVLTAFFTTMEGRDPYTAHHSERVAQLAYLLAGAPGINISDRRRVKRSGEIHDLGKIRIRDDILNKSGSLSDDESKLMREHPRLGAGFLSGQNVTGHRFDVERDFTLYHHERYDGEGYPDRLKGADIPMVARIGAVVDVFDALNSDRCYRPRLSEGEIIESLREGRGTKFDPEITDHFLFLLPTIVFTTRQTDERMLQFHTPFCREIPRLAINNLVITTREQAESTHGYVPCPSCSR